MWYPSICSGFDDPNWFTMNHGRLHGQPNAREAPWSDDVQRGGFGTWPEAPSRKRWKRATPQEGEEGKCKWTWRWGRKGKRNHSSNLKKGYEDTYNKTQNSSPSKKYQFFVTFLGIHSLKLTVRTWKWMVGRWISFWDGLFSGAMLVSGRVYVWVVSGRTGRTPKTSLAQIALERSLGVKAAAYAENDGATQFGSSKLTNWHQLHPVNSWLCVANWSSLDGKKYIPGTPNDHCFAWKKTFFWRVRNQPPKQTFRGSRQHKLMAIWWFKFSIFPGSFRATNLKQKRWLILSMIAPKLMLLNTKYIYMF